MNRPKEHFRRECHRYFDEAQPGSIDLRGFAGEFRNTERIRGLKAEFSDLVNGGGFDIEIAERIEKLLAELRYELRRAAFPARYVEYGVLGFGSARLGPEDPDYIIAKEIMAQFSSRKRVIGINGGGPGAMSGFTEGIAEGNKRRLEQKNLPSGSRSHGVTVSLPFEEHPSRLLDTHSHHHVFGDRIAEMLDNAHSVVAVAGGMGTDLENSFALQLAQVGHLEPGFLLLFSREWWEGIHAEKIRTFWDQRNEQGRTPLISSGDSSIINFFESPEDSVAQLIRHHAAWKVGVFEKLDQKSKALVNGWAYEKSGRNGAK